MKKEKVEKIIPVMFHGERAGLLGRNIHQLFKTKEGEELSFSKIKNIYFGECYEAALLADGHFQMQIRPKSLGELWTPSEKERLEYEAQKLVVMSVRQERRKAMQLKKPHKNILRAVELIAPFYRAMSHIDQTRFMGWFRNECSKKRKGKK